MCVGHARNPDFQTRGCSLLLSPRQSARPGDRGQGLWGGCGPVDYGLLEDAALPPGALRTSPATEKFSPNIGRVPAHRPGQRSIPWCVLWKAASSAVQSPSGGAACLLSSALLVCQAAPHPQRLEIINNRQNKALPLEASSVFLDLGDSCIFPMAISLPIYGGIPVPAGVQNCSISGSFPLCSAVVCGVQPFYRVIAMVRSQLGKCM